MRLAYQMFSKDLLKKFSQYNKSTIYKHCKLSIVSEVDCVDRERNNMGRPKSSSIGIVDWRFAKFQNSEPLRDHLHHVDFKLSLDWTMSQTGNLGGK